MKNFFTANDRLELTKRIQRLTAENKRQWGRMSVNQMVCHITDQIRLATGEIQSQPGGSFIHHSLLKWLVLSVMPAPKGKVQTYPLIDQEIGGTKPTELSQDVNTLLQLINKLSIDKEETTKFYPHPAFGNLSVREWGRLIYIHMDHHLKQFGI